MNDKMSVIYIKQTGHVVGAVTCNSDPTRQLAPEDVATPAFFVTPPLVPVPAAGAVDTTFEVPSSVLLVSSPVDFDDAVFASPSSFAFGDGVNEGVPPAPSVIAIKKGSTLPTPPPMATLQIDLGSVPTVDTPVFIVVQDPASTTTPPDRRVLAAVITAGTARPASLPLTILPGGSVAAVLQTTTYSIAAYVGGFQPIFLEQSIGTT